MANVRDPENLCRALDGCDGAFHTSAFVDSGGISGYTVISTANVFLWTSTASESKYEWGSSSHLHFRKRREEAPCVKLHSYLDCR